MLKALKNTILSLAGVDAAAPDNRKQPRRNVRLEASIYVVDVFSDIVIRNVSVNGFMGEADVMLEEGQTLHLSLDNKAFQTGTVRWAKGTRFGVEFDIPLAPAAAGDDEPDDGDSAEHRQRARRATLNIPARLNLSGAPFPANVKNLSQNGMLLETHANVTAGQHILVRLGSRTPIAAVARWSNNGQVGIETNEPIGILSFLYSMPGVDVGGAR